MRILFILALLANAQAATISFTDDAGQSLGPGGYQKEFAGVLEVPMFDPLLGTLDSISYTLRVSTNATWNVLFRHTSNLLTDTIVGGSYSFLDSQYDFSSSSWTTSGPICGPGAPPEIGPGDPFPYPVCPTISSDGAHKTINGAITDLEQYIGQEMLSLPLLMSLNYSTNLTNHPLIGIGDLAGARAGGSLTWKYNYAPAPPTVSEVPEPGTFGACAVALIAAAWVNRKKLLERDRRASPPRACW